MCSLTETSATRPLSNIHVQSLLFSFLFLLLCIFCLLLGGGGLATILHLKGPRLRTLTYETQASRK